jgi:hypothetical protein
MGFIYHNNLQTVVTSLCILLYGPKQLAKAPEEEYGAALHLDRFLSVTLHYIITLLLANPEEY